MRRRFRVRVRTTDGTYYTSRPINGPTAVIILCTTTEALRGRLPVVVHHRGGIITIPPGEIDRVWAENRHRFQWEAL